MHTKHSLKELDAKHLSHLVRYDDGYEQDDLFVLVGEHYYPVDSACDIIRERLIPSLVEKIYQNKMTMSQANKKLKELEHLYPSPNGVYYTPSRIELSAIFEKRS